MRKISSAIFLFLCVALSGCVSGGTPKVMLNALQLPPHVQVAILYAKADPEQTDKQLSVKVFWHNVHGYLKRIHGQGVTEVFTETEPLDFQSPKTFPGNTVAVGIKILVLNDSQKPMRYRITRIVTTGSYQKTEVVYDGIREANEFVLEGPAIRNQQHEIRARIELVGKGGFILDSVETDTLKYSINSSGKN